MRQEDNQDNSRGAQSAEKLNEYMDALLVSCLYMGEESKGYASAALADYFKETDFLLPLQQKLWQLIVKSVASGRHPSIEVLVELYKQEIGSDGKQFEDRLRAWLDKVKHLRVDVKDKFEEIVSQAQAAASLRALSTLPQAVEAVLASYSDPTSALEAIRKLVDRLSPSGYVTLPSDIEDAYKTAQERGQSMRASFQDAGGHPPLVLPYEFGGDILRAVGPLDPQDLIIISAQPGGGKTTALVQMALSFASKGNRVAILTAETPVHDYFNRMAARYANVPVASVRLGACPDVLTRFYNAFKPKPSPDGKAVRPVFAPIEFLWVGETSSEALLSTLARLGNRVCDKPNVVIVDYLQLFAHSRRNRLAGYEQYEALATRLAVFARQYNILVVVAAQETVAQDGSVYVYGSRAPQQRASLYVSISGGNVAHEDQYYHYEGRDYLVAPAGKPSIIRKLKIIKNTRGEVGEYPVVFIGKLGLLCSFPFWLHLASEISKARTETKEKFPIVTIPELYTPDTRMLSRYYSRYAEPSPSLETLIAQFASLDVVANPDNA